MKYFFVTLFLFAIKISFYTQTSTTNTCDISNLIINTIFYPNTTTTYTNGLATQKLYLCGPNTIVYDTAQPCCRNVLINPNCIYYTNAQGYLMPDFIFVSNNATVVIKPNNSGPGSFKIYYEVGGVIIDQTNGVGVETYSCSSFIFPSVNCTSTNLLESKKKQNSFDIYPNPSNNVLTVEMPTPELFSRIKIINSLNQVVREEEVTSINKIIINDLPNGIYLLNLFSSKLGTASKRFVIAR